MSSESKQIFKEVLNLDQIKRRALEVAKERFPERFAKVDELRKYQPKSSDLKSKEEIDTLAQEVENLNSLETSLIQLFMPGINFREDVIADILREWDKDYEFLINKWKKNG